ncbi:MAG: helix-turn-helix transcriptional regulator [Oscillospiraceae bacterium]|nr:helix-turn-helix transcriptional regulator [Oscillospiraceae bacterium]MBQ3561033.1 helix-turn-helix transcriptional regulator [Oscillospiraceae bacterium]MBQ6700392.1 helix-turn-helix transcriptional regulator [Oscillospiraceae bacterium]
MNRIKKLREARGMTQIRLSIELEVSQETISAYEKEKYYPSYQSLLKLSEIFGASIDYIMGLSDKMTVERNLDMQEETILSMISSLDKNKKEKIIAYIQGISEN